MVLIRYDIPLILYRKWKKLVKKFDIRLLDLFLRAWSVDPPGHLQLTSQLLHSSEWSRIATNKEYIHCMHCIKKWVIFNSFDFQIVVKSWFYTPHLLVSVCRDKPLVSVDLEWMIWCQWNGWLGQRTIGSGKTGVWVTPDLKFKRQNVDESSKWGSIFYVKKIRGC